MLPLHHGSSTPRVHARPKPPGGGGGGLFPFSFFFSRRRRLLNSSASPPPASSTSSLSFAAGVSITILFFCIQALLSRHALEPSPASPPSQLVRMAAATADPPTAAVTSPPDKSIPAPIATNLRDPNAALPGAAAAGKPAAEWPSHARQTAREEGRRRQQARARRARRLGRGVDDDFEEGDQGLQPGSDDDDVLSASLLYHHDPDEDDDALRAAMSHYGGRQRKKKKEKKRQAAMWDQEEEEEEEEAAMRGGRRGIVEQPERAAVRRPLAAAMEEEMVVGGQHPPPLLDCQAGHWRAEASAAVRRSPALHRLERVCFDYKRELMYAMDDDAEADIPEAVWRHAPYLFAGSLPQHLAQTERSQHVAGATLFLRFPGGETQQREGDEAARRLEEEEGRLLDWASAVLPLASSRFVAGDQRVPWAQALHQLHTVVLDGASQQSYFSEESEWMRDLLDGVLDYARNGDGPAAAGGEVERLFLTPERKTKRPIMCFDTVLVPAPAAADGPGGGEKAGGKADEDEDEEEEDGQGQGMRPRPWRFYPNACAAWDLQQSLLPRLLSPTAPSSSSPDSPAPQRPPPPSSSSSSVLMLLLPPGQGGWEEEEDAAVAKTRGFFAALPPPPSPESQPWAVRVLHASPTQPQEEAAALSVARVLVSPNGPHLVRGLGLLPLGASVVMVTDCHYHGHGRPSSHPTPGQGEGGGKTSSSSALARLAVEAGLRVVTAAVADRPCDGLPPPGGNSGGVGGGGGGGGGGELYDRVLLPALRRAVAGVLGASATATA